MSIYKGSPTMHPNEDPNYEPDDPNEGGSFIGNRKWDPRAVEQVLNLEMHPVDGEPAKKPQAIAKQTLIDNVALVAYGLVYTAIHSENENLRTKAQMYIIDRVFGKVTDIPIDAAADVDKVTKMFESVSVSDITGETDPNDSIDDD
jgi:hypothetical protein